MQSKDFRKLITPAVLPALLPCLLLYQIFAGGCLLPANLLKDVYPWRTGNPKDLVPWNVLQFDGITQFYPWRFFAAQTWRSGLVPLWNPHQFCGTPFLANGQSAVLYPPNLIFLTMPVRFAFGWSALLHLAFTGMAAYLFFRRAGGSSRWGAAIGAACWQLSTWQVSWLALPTFLNTSAWLPAALLGVYYVAKAPSPRRSAALAVIVAMMVLAGHLQIAFYCLSLTLIYGIYLVIAEKVAPRNWTRAAIACGSIAFLLTAAQILPTVELSRLSARGGAKASASGYSAYISLAMPIEQTAGLFVPGLPYPENAGYVGVFGLMLALIAMMNSARKKLRIFFGAVAVVALLIAMGTPINMLLYYAIPGFASTGSPARILVIFTFGIAFLASQGVDDVLSNEKRVFAGTGAYSLIAILTIGLALASLVHLDSNYLAYAQNDLRLFTGLLLGCLAVLWLLRRKTIAPASAATLIFLVTVVDLIFVNFGYNPVVNSTEVYPVTPVIAWLQQHAGYDRVMPLNARWSNTEPPLAVLPPNGATVYSLYDLQGYDSLQTRAYREFANAMNARGDIPPENGNITFTFAAGSPQARAADARYLVSIEPVNGFGSPVITDGQVSVYVDSAAVSMAGAMKLVSLSATRADYYGAASFVTPIQDYPGWEQFTGSGTNGSNATISGRAVAGPFIRVNLSQPGPVELRYQPVSFRIGLYLTLIGISLTITLLGLPTVTTRWYRVSTN